jgi:hypothetical protein
MAILPKVIDMLNAFPMKIPTTFIMEIEKSTIKCIWKYKKLKIAKKILRKKCNVGGITIPNFKTVLQSNSNKNSMVLHRNRQGDQCNRIEDPDMSPHSYTHLIFGKGAKNIQWRKDSLFSKWCWENWISTCRKLKLDPCLLSCTSDNSSK